MKKVESTAVVSKVAKASPRWKGTVVSSVMDKTIVVAVETLKTHSLYGKQYRSTKKYHVHDPDNTAKKNDVVAFESCRPMSKTKKYQLSEILKKA
jgi:small subunit ribosomal protein S17